jgi:hypothetical protein
MVLASFGQNLSELEVRRLLGNPRFGLTLGQAAFKLQEAGAIIEHHFDWSLDDVRDCLRAGYYPIIGIERRFFGYPSAAHAVVITAVQSAAILALDPLIGPENQVYQLLTFERAWQSAGKEAVVLLKSW